MRTTTGIPRARLQLDVEVDGTTQHYECCMADVTIGVHNYFREHSTASSPMDVVYEIVRTEFKIRGHIERNGKTNE